MSKISGTIPPPHEELVMLFDRVGNVEEQVRSHFGSVSKVSLWMHQICTLDNGTAMLWPLVLLHADQRGHGNVIIFIPLIFLFEAGIIIRGGFTLTTYDKKRQKKLT